MPNFIARNLAAKQSNTIGLVVPKIAHNFFAPAIESIYQTAYDHHYEIIMTVSQENAEHEIKHIQTLLSMRVDGLLISLTEQTREHAIFDTAKQRNVPLVFFDRMLPGLGFSSVTSDDEQGACQAIEYLIQQGRTKIAHVAGYAHTNIGSKRSAGFKKAMAAHNHSVPEEWIITGGFGEEDGYKGFKKLLKRKPLPEVIFAVTYPVALGICTAAAEVGISVPDDIDILSFGGSAYNRLFSPSISYVEQPAAALGRKATELLLDEITNPDRRREQHIVMPTQLVICET